MASIVVTGYMIRHPLAGNMFAYFHYLLGLERLGHEVLYLEESGWPGSCYDPVTQGYSDDPREGISRVRQLFRRYELDTPVCYVNRETGETFGLERGPLEILLSHADLLLNLGGVCALPEFQLVKRRAFLDMDPLFTQAGRFASEDLEDYQVHFSYGTNIGQAGCSVPTRGIAWLPAIPPVVPELWADASRPHGADESGEAECRPLTTIANWSAYGAISYGGERFGQKDQEFLRVLELPRRTGQPLELAVAGAVSEVKERLLSAGWSIRDAGEVSVHVPGYQEYIIGSRGEFSAAKHAYVKTHSGWFSDRSVCYLAAGRPVIVQDTGIGPWLPRGQGVHTFSSLDEAVECIAAVNVDYPAQRRAAAALAGDIFAYQTVLPRLVERALGAISHRRPATERGAAG
jgi:hypothetical protein